MHEATPHPWRSRLASSAAYPWLVVGLLWFCGFFNYADRQAVYSVFPLLKSEFHLDNEQLGLLGSAFMLVYAVTSPFSGYTVDLLSRRLLIGLGLAFWSLICAATALSRNFVQLVLFRGAEGLGEAFYFPASMSVLADYHGPRTRSRAMSIHQTSVYLGTAGGAVLAGYLGQHYGWRSPFWALGLTGLAYAVFLGTCLVEPARNQAEGKTDGPEAHRRRRRRTGVRGRRLRARCRKKSSGSSRIPPPPCSWPCSSARISSRRPSSPGCRSIIFEKFKLDLADSSLISTAWPLASLVGALGGGVAADWSARRSAGGRILIQSLGLILAAPFVFFAGQSSVARHGHRGLDRRGAVQGDLRCEHLRLALRRRRSQRSWHRRGPDEHRGLDRRVPRPLGGRQGVEEFRSGCGHRFDGRRVSARRAPGLVRLSPGRGPSSSDSVRILPRLERTLQP